MLDLKLPLILASGSPRRKEILDIMGLTYTVDIPDVDESCSGEPDKMVMELSKRKALAVARRYDSALVLAADTLVYHNGVLGKPKSPEEAFMMLSALSGNWHSVYTGITLVNTFNHRVITHAEMTRVHFEPMTSDDIHSYIDTHEPLDKAGSYGIQGRGGMYIDRIEGSYSNVVGLPMSALRRMLADITKN